MCVHAIVTVLVGVESLDVLDEGHDAARKHEDEGDDAQNSDDIQPNEHISSWWKHGGRRLVWMEKCTTRRC